MALTTAAQRVFDIVQHTEARRAILRAIALDPTLTVAHRRWGMALSAVGRLAGGMAPEPLSALRIVFEAAGFARACGALADFFTEHPVVFMRRGMHIAILRALAGQSDEAFATLEAAATRGDPSLVFLLWQPAFDSLKADPRYAPLTKRVRLVG